MAGEHDTDLQVVKTYYYSVHVLLWNTRCLRQIQNLLNVEGTLRVCSV